MRSNILKIDSSRDYLQCAHCGGDIECEADWLGEDDRGRGMYDAHYRCEDCGRWITEIQYE